MSHFRMRRSVGALLSAAVLAGILVVLLVGAGASSAASQGGCLLQGNANFTPGATLTAKATSYTFSGTFSSCKGVGPKKGTVTASGTGAIACISNQTHGTATISWSNGQTSGLSFTTKGKGSLVNVSAKFTSGLFAGQTAAAKLSFYTTAGDKCNTPGGLPSASFAGPATIGI